MKRIYTFLITNIVDFVFITAITYIVVLSNTTQFSYLEQKKVNMIQLCTSSKYTKTHYKNENIPNI